jgi:hypothetical protein
MVNNVGELTMQKDAWVYRDELKAGFKYNKQFVVDIFNAFSLSEVVVFLKAQGLVEDLRAAGSEFSGPMNKGWGWKLFKGAEYWVHVLELNGVTAELTVLTNNKKNIDTIYDVLVAACMIETIEEKRAKREATAAKRMAALAKKGLGIGSEVAWGEGSAVIESITNAGVVKLRLPNGEIEKSKPHFLQKVAK